MEEHTYRRTLSLKLSTKLLQAKLIRLFLFKPPEVRPFFILIYKFSILSNGISCHMEIGQISEKVLFLLHTIIIKNKKIY